MDELKIQLPKLGESIVSATVIKWLKKGGDPVALDEPLLEVSTDKVNSEIPSPASGVLKEIFVQVGEEVEVGATLAILSHEGSPSSSIEIPNGGKEVQKPLEKDHFLSPAVMRLIQEKGIPLSAVEKIPRKGGRLTKKDVEVYARCPAVSKEGTERIQITGLRKAIADNISLAYREIPHASLTTEVDVTNLLEMIEKRKKSFFEEHGCKLSITAFAAESIARAVKEFPLLNSSIENDAIVVKKFVNLGIAVGVDQGVVVPVIKKSAQFSIFDFAKAIKDLSLRAREGQLKPDEVQEGSITLTNFGVTGVPLGTPIIRYPEVAIIGLGAIVKKAVVMPDNKIEVRSMMWVSVTFDHRVLDGLYGCGFLNKIKSYLEAEFSMEEP